MKVAYYICIKETSITRPNLNTTPEKNFVSVTYSTSIYVNK